MARYVLVFDGKVTNAIEWDGGSPLLLSGELHQHDVASIGDVWPYVPKDPIPPAQRDLVLSQIYAMESQITPRRLREALISDQGKAWIVEIETQINTLRGSL